MSPKTMVSGGDTETGPEVIEDGPAKGWCSEGSVECCPNTKHRNQDDEGNVEFVDMLP